MFNIFCLYCVHVHIFRLKHTILVMEESEQISSFEKNQFIIIEQISSFERIVLMGIIRMCF